MKIKKKNKMKIILLVFVVLIVMFAVVSCMSPKWGRAPRGEIMKRIEASPNYRDGRFHNISPDPKITLGLIFAVRRTRVEDKRPSNTMPSMKTDLHKIDRNENVLVWIGHSSLFIQVDGVRFLIDPVLVTASPFPFFARPFKGTKIYTPDDIPEIDYLLITHDHWDHLDYQAVKKIKNRIGKVICGLGVGEHFRRWKFNSEDIIELDWNENAVLTNEINLHFLPSQHNSARNFLKRNRTLWGSFMIEAPSLTTFISGDTYYGSHFYEIGKQFPKIDLAIIEFGQYLEHLKVHIMPEDFPKVINDLKPERIFTTHHAKYALGQHSWYEPLELVTKFNEQYGFNIITPMKGELVNLNDFSQDFSLWWKTELNTK